MCWLITYKDWRTLTPQINKKYSGWFSIWETICSYRKTMVYWHGQFQAYKSEAAIPYIETKANKLYHDVDFYLCDGSYLVKIGRDGLIMRCLDDKETRSITWHYPHSSAYGRHHNEEMTVTKFCKVVFGGQPNWKIVRIHKELR